MKNDARILHAMNKVFTLLGACVLSVGGVACGQTEEFSDTGVALEVGQGQDAVIYGTDNRRDVYAETNPARKAFVQSSVMAMISKDAFGTPTAAGGVRLRAAGTYGSNNGLCSTERFVNQPAVASCSGTLVGPDLVLTAGHCVENGGCSDFNWVFNYSLSSATTMSAMSTSDVFSCKRVEQYVRDDQTGADYAVVRLDRSVGKGHTPARVRHQTATPVRANQPLFMAGSPAGLPTKITDDARVFRASTPAFFEASLDAFAGNSGSGVFDPTTFDLVGILVRGNNDFSYNRTRRCYIAQSCTAGSPNPAAGCYFAAEHVSYPPAAL